jgi:hypothetical protein
VILTSFAILLIPLLYSPNAKDPQKRIIYHRVVEMLEEGKAISKIEYLVLVYVYFHFVLVLKPLLRFERLNLS